MPSRAITRSGDRSTARPTLSSGSRRQDRGDNQQQAVRPEPGRNERALEIEEEAAAERDGRPVLGKEKILAQDPCQRLGTSKKSPAPMLIFADRPEVREAMSNDYKDLGTRPAVIGTPRRYWNWDHSQSRAVTRSGGESCAYSRAILPLFGHQRPAASPRTPISCESTTSKRSTSS